MERLVEICCGSYEDALNAYYGRAKRIELNSALHLGGLTPAIASLKVTKKSTNLKIITMIRPRGAGFCYNDIEFEVMKEDARCMLENKADGIAFGCLNQDGSINEKQTKEMIDIIKEYQGEVVFHRAFDCVADPYASIELLIHLGVDRILTSGLKPKAMDGKEVIIRTLDVGGDKNIPYLGMEKEDNPFLGFRAVRYCLDRKEMYKIQLRALIRASVFGKIKIMIPLVTCVNELREVKVLVEDIKADLDRENIPYDKNISVGVMIETPAASEIADLLAKEADFFSIGTNDLTQYTMAVDRGNSKVAYLYSVYNPAVIRSIKRIISAAANENIIAGMCGEAAADPLLTPLLISFGLKEFSVNASSILRTRAQIAKWTKAEADKVADEVMKCATQEEVYEILKRYER